MKTIVDYNPWPGLSSYDDPATANRVLKFCGRDNDSYDVAELVMDNTFVTLYGKSGIGKTSLLNAGVFPELRKEHFSPLSLRLGMRDQNKPQNYQNIIIEAVKKSVFRVEENDVIPAQDDQQSVDYLWKFFANHRFYDKDDKPTIPVIVLDQFEEVFRYIREKADLLLRQLDNCAVNGTSHRYDLNVRFVVSIREDDLYLLEDSIDNCYLPALKRCRYRLHSLKEDGAKEAIVKPGEGLFRAEEQDAIVQAIVKIARNKDDQGISTNLLSLICNRLYVESQKSGSSYISLALVESFVKDNPFERFYNEATHGLSNREKSYIEEHFVDSTGRRNSIPESDFMLHVKEGKKLIEGKNRILQRVSTSSDGKNYRIELIHDSFCEPLSMLKDKRRNHLRILQLFGLASIIILISGVALFVWHQNVKLVENHVKTVASTATQLIEDGDSYTARMLLQEIEPKTHFFRYNNPYTIEWEVALRKAYKHNNAILKANEELKSISFNPVRNLIASSDRYGNIIVWESSSGATIKYIKGNGRLIKTIDFSPNGVLLATGSNDDTIRIFNCNTWVCDQKIPTEEDYLWAIKFSPDGNYLLSDAGDGHIAFWDTRTFKIAYKTSEKHYGIIESIEFNPAGDKIVTCADDTIRVWDYKTGHLLHKLIGHSGSVDAACFNEDGCLIASGSSDQTIRIWDVNKEKCIDTLYDHGVYDIPSLCFYGDNIISVSGHDIKIWDNKRVRRTLSNHTQRINSIVLIPLGKQIASASNDRTIRLWDLDSKDEVSKVWKRSYGGDNIVFFEKSMKFIASGRPTFICDVESGDTTNINFDSDYVALSKDGQYAILVRDMSFVIYNISTKQFSSKFTGHTGIINSAVFSSDGKRILTASKDGLVKLWDIEGDSCLKTYSGHKNNVLYATFSPDETLIASASTDIRFWDVETCLCKDSILEKNMYYRPIDELLYRTIDFTSDGKYILTAGDNTIKLWDLKTLEVVKTYEESSTIVSGASFNDDEKLIISSSWDNSCKIWDSSSGKIIESFGKSLPAFLANNDMSYPSISYNNKWIAYIYRGDVELKEFIPIETITNETHDRFKNRQLTHWEKQKYYLE